MVETPVVTAAESARAPTAASTKIGHHIDDEERERRPQLERDEVEDDK